MDQGVGPRAPEEEDGMGKGGRIEKRREGKEVDKREIEKGEKKSEGKEGTLPRLGLNSGYAPASK